MKSRDVWKLVPTTCLMLAAVFPGSDVRALTDEEIFLDLPFSLGNPGARALGLGGAYIAAVDDATASETNPAALQYLGGIEIFGDFSIFDSIAADGITTQKSIGSNDPSSPALPYLDYDASLAAEGDNSVTYLSVAIPFSFGTRPAAFAVSRQVVLDVHSATGDNSVSFALEGFPLWINPVGEGGRPAIEQYTVSGASNGAMRTTLVNYNFGFAMPLMRDLSFGLTATVTDLDVRSLVSNRFSDPRAMLQPANPRVDDDGDGLFDDIVTESVVDGEDRALSYTVGVHYHPDSLFRNGRSPIRLGLVYRKGASLGIRQTLTELEAGTGLPQLDPLTRDPLQEVFVNQLRMPDRWGLGMATFLGRGWMFAVDVERIEYGDLMSDFRAGTSFLTGGVLEQAASGRGEPLGFEVDDATIAHVGLEYGKVVGSWRFALRGGYYNDPDSSIRMTQPGSDSDELRNAIAETFGGGVDQNHVTGGFSVTSPAGFEIQFAGDFSDATDRYLISTLWRFGKSLR